MIDTQTIKALLRLTNNGETIQELFKADKTGDYEFKQFSYN